MTLDEKALQTNGLMDGQTMLSLESLLRLKTLNISIQRQYFIQIYFRNQLLRPNEITQREILSAAIAELLWKVGGKKQAILAVPETNPVFEASVRFSMDGVTEKLHLFKCTKEEEIKNTLKKHIYFVSMERKMDSFV